MKSIKKITFTAVAALALAGVGTTGLTSFAGVTSNTVEATPNTSLQTKLNELNQKVAKLNNQVSMKQVEISKINTKIEKSKAEIAKTKSEIKAAKKELDERKEVLRDQVVELQKESNKSVSGNIYIDYLLSSDNFSDLIGRSMAVGKISSANKAAIDDVNEAKSKLNALAESQEAEQAKIVAAKAKADSEMTSLKAAKTKAKESQTKLQQEMWDNRKELEASQKADSAKTQQLVKTAWNATTTQAAKSFKGSSSLIQNAAQFIGVPYVYGGETPAGFDCSGLVRYAAKMAGISLPRTSQKQSAVGSYVSVSQLQAGDLVFWGGASHVGIYIGGGQYIHAPRPGENVKVGSVQYYTPSFGRRL